MKRLFLALLIIATCLFTFIPANIEAKTTYTTAEVTSKAITCGKYKVMLKDSNLTYTKSKKTTIVDRNVLEAFSYKNEILYRTSSDVKIYNLKQDTIRNVYIRFPDANITVGKISLAGFSNDTIYYFDPHTTRALYKYKEGDVDSVCLSNGQVGKFYVIENDIFIKEQNTEGNTSKGSLIKVNYVTGKKNTLKTDVDCAHITSKFVYYVTYGDYTYTLGVGNIEIYRIDLNVKNKKEIAKIDNVDTNGYLITTNKACIYLGKDGKYHKYTYSNKKTTDYSQYKAEELLKKSAVLY